MHAAPSQILRIVALAALAVLLGMVLLVLDKDRRADVALATSGPAPASQPLQRTDASKLVAGSVGRADGRIVPATAAQAAPVSPSATAAPTAPTAPSPTTDTEPPTDAVPVAKRGGVVCGEPHRLVEITRNVQARATPGGRVIGSVPAQSKYLGRAMQVWVQAVSADGAWGKVTLPWTRPVNRAAWVPLAGRAQSATRVMVVGDLSDRTLRVYRDCAQQFEAPMAIGASGSPSPLGRFWVTDPVAVPKSQPYFGSYAFGLSTIQPNPPAGWTGGNQMAIHGTNSPNTIGTPASAGCLRVSESTLARLRTMVGVGTPVIIQR